MLVPVPSSASLSAIMLLSIQGSGAVMPNLGSAPGQNQTRAYPPQTTNRDFSEGQRPVPLVYAWRRVSRPAAGLPWGHLAKGPRGGAGRGRWATDTEGAGLEVACRIGSTHVMAGRRGG